MTQQDPFVLQDTQTKQKYPIPPDGLRIGRMSQNDITLASDEVSRTHATLWIQDGQLFVRDEESTNGTWVNGERVTAPQMLQANDRMRIGDKTFEVIIDAPPVVPPPGGVDARPAPHSSQAKRSPPTILLAAGGVIILSVIIALIVKTVGDRATPTLEPATPTATTSIPSVTSTPNTAPTSTQASMKTPYTTSTPEESSSTAPSTSEAPTGTSTPILATATPENTPTSVPATPTPKPVTPENTPVPPTVTPAPLSSSTVSAFLSDARQTKESLNTIKIWFDRLAGGESIACSTVYGHAIHRPSSSAPSQVPELSPTWNEYQTAITEGQRCLQWMIDFCEGGGGTIDESTFWDRRDLSSQALSRCERVVRTLEGH